LLRRVVDALDAAGIDHLVVGSYASTAYGHPRFTQDIDMVIDPTPEALDQFVAAFEPADVYIGPNPQAALAERDMFNLIDHAASGWKVDLIIPDDSAFGRNQVVRRVRTVLMGVETWVASPEDTVLAKLRWAAESDSERQVADASGVLEVQGDAIDDEYLDRWAEVLGVTELLEKARTLAELPPD
jgi:hypothetical protein